MHSIVRISKEIENPYAAINRDLFLTTTEFRILLTLEQSSPMAMQDLAVGLHLDLSMLISVVDCMAGKTLIRRGLDACDCDRWRASWILTRKGRQILKTAQRKVEGRLLQCLSVLGAERIGELQEILQVMEARLLSEELAQSTNDLDGHS
jgi:DNA-binding MarR family transcriptional regulator